MATVNVLSADAIHALVDAALNSASLNSDGDLIFTTVAGDTVNLGGLLTEEVVLSSEPSTDDPDLMTLSVSGVTRLWWNEWRALRGRNPYTTFADALVRAIVQDGDVTSGNALEINDRRTSAPATVLWGVNWGTGAVTQGDSPVGMVYTLDSGQTDADIPATLPAGTLIIQKTV